MFFGKRKKAGDLPETKREQPTNSLGKRNMSERADAGFSFESARICLLEKSARNGWRCAGLFGLTTLLCVAAIFKMLPLKERVPYIVEVEKTTGTAQVLQPVGEERAVPHSELMDKHFISKYIRCREGYDNRTVAGDFEIVKYLSMPDVFEPYLQQFKRKNPANPDEKYGEKPV